MPSSAEESRRARARRARVTEEFVTLELSDGRTVQAPLAWYPRLAGATQVERNQGRLIGQREGVHWPAVDEGIPVDDVLAGQRSAERCRTVEPQS